MVSYCCVRNCHNNSNEKKKRYETSITFHAFPSNLEARLKWLKAIGRPMWDPPSHARICSAHFRDDQVKRDHQRTRLRDDACPVFALPVDSYLEVTQMEVCRVCLVTDVKMFSLQQQVLKICMKTIGGLSKDDEGLPQYVCFECALQLIKCHNLVEKCLVAKNTLMNLFAKYGEVSMDLVKNINRSKLNLNSSLIYNASMPNTVYELQFDEDIQKYIYTNKTEHKANKNVDINKDKVLTNNEMEKDIFDNYVHDEEMKFKDSLEFKEENNEDFTDLRKEESKDHDFDEGNMDDHVTDDIYDEEDLEPIKELLKKDSIKTQRKSHSSKNSEGLTPDEVEMQKYFNIVILSVEEEIADRLKMKESPAYRDALYKCDICFKTYLHPDAYKMHIDNHDPSRGDIECPVCKVRYKSDAQARSHSNRAHGKKFYCKTCPKVFNYIRIAKIHQKRHEGYVYKCSSCKFTSPHESAYHSHVRSHNDSHACSECGLTYGTARGLALHTQRSHPTSSYEELALYRCKQCDLQFTSESSWRVHMLTSSKHKRDSDGDSTQAIKTSCPKCGVKFPTAHLLHEHNVSEHGKGRKLWTLTGDTYPTNCQHCDEVVNNRKEHYFHVRKMHPKERESYQPVITAVCDTCGKGFQNSTKLHLHSLRHKGVGTVQCPHCPRLFYDKYQLARHIGVHSDERPHRCVLCEKAFKLKSNLDRHAKVHSGATPYECTMCGKRFRYSSSRNLHVRTVHYKLPQPPRKKRGAKSRNIYENCP